MTEQEIINNAAAKLLHGFQVSDRVAFRKLNGYHGTIEEFTPLGVIVRTISTLHHVEYDAIVPIGR